MRTTAVLFVFLFLVFVSPIAASGSGDAPDTTTGLALHLPFDGAVNDASGGMRHGVMEGAYMAGDMCGMPNSALAFNMVDRSYVRVDAGPLSNAPGHAEQLTLALWVSSSIREGMRILVDKYDVHAPTKEFRLALNEGRPLFWWSGAEGDAEDPSDSVESPVRLERNEWSHIAVTFDEGRVTLYVNGVEVEEASSKVDSIVEGGAVFYVGGNFDGWDDTFFNGKIDDVRVYTRALDEEAVAALAASPCN